MEQSYWTQMDYVDWTIYDENWQWMNELSGILKAKQLSFYWWLYGVQFSRQAQAIILNSFILYPYGIFSIYFIPGNIRITKALYISKDLKYFINSPSIKSLWLLDVFIYLLYVFRLFSIYSNPGNEINMN